MSTPLFFVDVMCADCLDVVLTYPVDHGMPGAHDIRAATEQHVCPEAGKQETK
jgi:hypothetical protein